MATPAHKGNNNCVEGRLTPDQFRTTALLRGWTYRAIAERWECSENWISKIARDPNRAKHYDDAVRGLPLRKNNPND